MTRLTARHVEEHIVARLNAWAEPQGRSLEAKVRQILREAARAPTPRQLKVIAERITAMTPADRAQSDSTETIHADRDRVAVSP